MRVVEAQSQAALGRAVCRDFGCARARRTRAASLTTLTTAATIAFAAMVSGCGGSSKPVAASVGGTRDQSKWPADDRTLCEWRNKPELEVSEAAGPGALKPNVRRVFKVVGERDSRRRTLVCREIDSNLDGVKDVVRVFNTKGEAQREEADSNYDGKIDVWISFVGGRLAEVQDDTNHDGKADIWKYYTEGNLSRIKRDRNFDGKPDTWEVYARGHLERMGVDDTYDGHVDRWDRDQQAMLEAEMAEKQARDAMEGGNQQDAGAPSSTSTNPLGTAADAGR